MKVMLVTPQTHTIHNLRGDLVREIVARGHTVVALGPEADPEGRVAALGASFIPLPLIKNSTGPGHDLEYFRALLAIMRRERPDIVFSYTVKPVIYGSLAARLAGTRGIYPMNTGLGYVFTSDSPAARLLRFPVANLYRLGFACATRVFFQNSHDRDFFIRGRCVAPGKCVVVNGSGVNMERFAPAPLPPGPEVPFLMIARLMRAKGVLEYLEAARLVRQTHPRARFTLVGPLERIQDSLSRAEVAPFFEQGIVDYRGAAADVRPHIAACAVYVLPSHGEGISRTILEALSMGRPVITTDAPGCRETVVDGQNGFLVPVRDSAALADKMRWFLEHPGRIAPMGRASRKLCREKFEVGIINEQMMKTMNLQI